MQKFRKLLSVLLLSGALFACDNMNTSEGTSEPNSESIKPSETTSSSSSDDSSISEIVDTRLILEKQEAVSSIENYLDLNDYRQAEKEEITTIIESAKESIESAETIENVQTILANAKVQLDEVKTDAKLTEEEQLSLLNQTKQEALSSLENYLDLTNYRQAQKEEIASIIESSKESIESAETIESVKILLADAKTQLDEVKTDAQLTKEEQLALLNQAKQEALSSLDNYLDLTNYRQAQKEEIASIITNAKSTIESAETVENVQTILANAKTQLDEVKTDAQLTTEEQLALLNQAKQEALSSLDNYLDLTNYRQAQKEEIASIITNAKSTIESAETVENVQTILANAKVQLDEVKTDAQLTTEEQLALLNQAKQEALSSLDNYLDLNDYRQAEKEEIATIIESAKESIESAETIENVQTILANAKVQLDEVKTDEQLSALEPKIITSFENGQVFTNSRATLDVFAKNANGEKLSYSKVTVKVNGQVASINWDDNVKTSYNFVFQEGENLIEVTVVDGDIIKTETYTVIYDVEKAATITVSIEAFTVGLGYLVEPVNFSLDEANLSDMASYYGYASVEEFELKLSMAHILDYVLTLYGYEMSYQGSLESTWNGFYMSSISGLDITSIYIPEELYEQLDMNGFYVDEEIYDPSTLCEFDYTWGSGWMYMVNGSFPNVPFCDYVPQDGDVMRVQFTLAYGADIGDWGMMGEPFFEPVERETLTKLIATALEKGIDVTSAMEIVSTFGVTQEELDAAAEELSTLING